MKKYLCMAMAMGCAATFAPLNVWAQAAVSDPQATVPAVVYQSVFKESPTGVETRSIDWKKANADVAQFARGHVDILKWEEAQTATKPVVKPAETPAAQPASATPPTVHKH